MKSIEVYHLKINGVYCRLYWSEIGGVESFITGLNGVKYSSDDSDYYDNVVIEEWITHAVIDGGKKTDSLIDDSNNTVISLEVEYKETYLKEGV